MYTASSSSFARPVEIDPANSLTSSFESLLVENDRTKGGGSTTSLAFTIASSRSRRAVEAVEKHLGLNRETLRRQRYVIYDQLKSFLLVWRQGDAQLKQVAEQQIRAMCDGKRQFAGMCRYFSQAAGFA